MKKMQTVLWILLAGLIASCAPKAFTAQERQIIDRPDSLMTVTVWPQDSAVLRTPCTDLGPAELNSPLLDALMARMLYTLRDPSQDGVGIAAPQVGISRRLVWVQRFDKAGDPIECYLNIRIDSLSGPVALGREGCLSLPGLRGMVPRSSRVAISYLRPGTLEPVSEQVEGFTAVIFQHECDHLDGILYTDRATEVFAVEE